MMLEEPGNYQFRQCFIKALNPDIMQWALKLRHSPKQSTLMQLRDVALGIEKSDEYIRAYASGHGHGTVKPKSASHSGSGSSHAKPSSSTVWGSHPTRPAHAVPRPTVTSKEPSREPRRSEARPAPVAGPSWELGPRPPDGSHQCYNCGQEGHFSNKCPHPPKAPRAYAAQVDDHPEPPGDECRAEGEDFESGAHEPPSRESDPDHGLADPEDYGEEPAMVRFSDLSETEELAPQARRAQVVPWDVAERECSVSGSQTAWDHAEEWIPRARAARVVPLGETQVVQACAVRAQVSQEREPRPSSHQVRQALDYILPQPKRERALQRTIRVFIRIGGIEANVLLDSCSTTDMISPEFAQVAGLAKIELEERMGLRLAVKGSSSKLNYGTWADVECGPIKERRYFDIVNLDDCDVILGTPFMWMNGITLGFVGEGVISQRGRHIEVPRKPSMELRQRPLPKDRGLKARQFFRADADRGDDRRKGVSLRQPTHL